MLISANFILISITLPVGTNYYEDIDPLLFLSLSIHHHHHRIRGEQTLHLCCYSSRKLLTLLLG